MQTEMDSELRQWKVTDAQGNLVENKLLRNNAANAFVGIELGVLAKTINANGGDGDDMILDAAVGAAGSLGVDSGESVWGYATDTEDK